MAPAPQPDLLLVSFNEQVLGTLANKAVDLRKLNNVVVDKAAKTVTSGGGCLARDLEKPAEAEGLGVVFGVVNETGLIP